jgi:hypothetical protein
MIIMVLIDQAPIQPEKKSNDHADGYAPSAAMFQFNGKLMLFWWRSETHNNRRDPESN